MTEPATDWEKLFRQIKDASSQFKDASTKPAPSSPEISVDKFLKWVASIPEAKRDYWARRVGSMLGIIGGSYLSVRLTYKATGWKQTKLRTYLMYSLYASVSSIAASMERIERRVYKDMFR